MDDLERKREFVASLYDGPKWKAQVKRMPDGQVIAIYLKEKKKAEEKNSKESKPDEDTPF